MTLLDEMKVACVRLIAEETPDGLGGRTVTWREGAAFEVALVPKRAGEGAEAQKRVSAARYVALTDPASALSYGDVFRRVADGATFRVAAACPEARTSETSCLDCAWAECERWEMP